MKLTLYTWNIQDGGGATDGRFEFVQAAHNKIVKDYDPDIIVINEHNSSLITDTTNYKHTTCFNRTKVLAKCCINTPKSVCKFGIVFNYGSYKIWAALVHCDINNKSKAINDFINLYLCNPEYIAIGDFNIDSSELLDDKHFGQYFVSKSRSESIEHYSRQLIFEKVEEVQKGILLDPFPAECYDTWSNNDDRGNYDFFISNIMDGEDENEPSLKWSVHNIRVAQKSSQRASDHNPVVVILEIPRPDPNDEQ